MPTSVAPPTLGRVTTTDDTKKFLVAGRYRLDR
ncbi:MAG: hypothetical protein JWR88_2038, partial [Pseudonocardia sp.]|nr:hypothetical protein [Pseudonocardia sp.]